MKLGANVNIANDNGKTGKYICRSLSHYVALHLAIQFGLSEGFGTLISSVNAINLNAIDKQGNTCLHLLFKSSAFYLSLQPGAQFRVLNKLISVGANTNVINKKGKTPLHLACEANNYLCAALIAASEGTNVNLQDSKGNTALHIVYQNWRNEDKNSLPIILVKCGAILDVKSISLNKNIHSLLDSKGLTPVDYIPKEAKQLLLSTKPEKVEIKEIKDYKQCTTLKGFQSRIYTDYSRYIKSTAIAYDTETVTNENFVLSEPSVDLIITNTLLKIFSVKNKFLTILTKR